MAWVASLDKMQGVGQESLAAMTGCIILQDAAMMMTDIQRFSPMSWEGPQVLTGDC